MTDPTGSGGIIDGARAPEDFIGTLEVEVIKGTVDPQAAPRAQRARQGARPSSWTYTLQSWGSRYWFMGLHCCWRGSSDTLATERVKQKRAASRKTALKALVPRILIKVCIMSRG